MINDIIKNCAKVFIVRTLFLYGEPFTESEEYGWYDKINKKLYNDNFEEVPPDDEFYLTTYKFV